MFSIRNGNPEDAAQIAQLLIKTWRECYQDFLPVSFLANLDLRKQVIRHQNYFQKKISYSVIENSDRKIVGFASFGKSRFTSFESEIELYTLYIDQAYQGKGFGKKLLQNLYQKITPKSSHLDVSVFERNPYLSFYLKDGFKEIGNEMIDFGEFAENTLILRKILN